MDKLFVDSNFFIALYNSSDSLHKRAVEVTKKLSENDPQIYISNYVFLETVTVLSQRVNRAEAVLRGNQLLENADFNLIHVDSKTQNQIWKLFCETKRKNTSFIDCSIVVIMKTQGINKLLTFDQDDFRPLLKKHHLSLF